VSSLAGRRILVTRAGHQAGKLSAALAALGAEPVELPVIEIFPPHTYEPLDRALHSLSGFGWMIVTSANTVAALTGRLANLGLTPEHMPKVAAVGPATAKAVTRAGWPLELMPEKYVAESLLDALGDRLRGQRVLLARSARARDVIPESLREQGIELDVVDAYRTEMPLTSLNLARELFAGGSTVDAVTFTSSSTAENFMEVLRETGCEVPPRLPAVSIGPITSRTLRESGWEPAAEAAEHSVEGLVRAVEEFFHSSGNAERGRGVPSS
jgi:uroporphyrinogen-III synthase